MRRTRALTTLATAVSGLLLALVGGGTAQAAGPSYVALGDSYSSGNGAGDYIDSSGDCHRSNSAYPALWAAANAPSSFSFAACSGAVTSDVTGSQISALNADTQLVSISIGGNDAGFADVMTTCVISSVDTCLGDIATAESFISGTLPGRLDATYDAIRAGAPDARVVVLGYPRMYIEPSPGCAGIGETKREAINDASDLLNTVIAERAAAHGFAFGDVRNTFDGHELCSGDDWLHDLALPVWESYHPTAVGHSSGYLPALNAND
ncbi:SGNH/GDSL hydrolase family protein [Streptomyces johnsoniae]|uniref:SGNH/GDSL hydrolase family protein n=1 Tax=Streptomyces johnsoniae TaxID=3075532 RepID=A0ABU2RWY3_9ACTN|nr:SGNH/GDSL hydrolase family protein [Streptomyces sp. DSM 41886]MDT0441263.1 SGNH/GDSL hydrolase family protein [Streptomyces sp. DSM 41886]